MNVDQLLRAVPLAKRAYLGSFLRYTKTDADAERIFAILQRQNFRPHFVETPAHLFIDDYESGGPPSYSIRQSTRMRDIP